MGGWWTMIPWLIGSTAHAVVAGTIRCAHDDRDGRNDAVRDGVDEVRTVLDDALLLVLLADHEAGDVLQEHERRVLLIAQLDELCALVGGLGKDHSVVGENADRNT